MLKISVGIDISKDNFTVTAQKSDSGGKVSTLFSKEFSNDKGGFVALAHRVKRHTPENRSDVSVVYVMKATGVYYKQLAYFLYDNRLKVNVQLTIHN